MVYPYFFFFFQLVISLTDTSDSQDSRERGVNHYFSCFPLPPAHKYAFNSSRFLPLFSIDLFVIIGLIADETCSP